MTNPDHRAEAVPAWTVLVCPHPGCESLRFPHLAGLIEHTEERHSDGDGCA